MKIGTFLNQIERAVNLGEIPDIPSGLKQLAEKGLSYVDVPSEMVDRYSPDQILAWLTPLGLTVESYIHCLPFRSLSKAGWFFYEQDTALQLQRCESLGCKLFMLVPEVGTDCVLPRNVLREQIVAYAEYVTRSAQSLSLHILMENYSFQRSLFSTPEDIDYILSHVPDLDFLLDTGNFWFSGTDMERATQKFARKTRHVHLKDLMPNTSGYLQIDGKGADSVALGAGILPLRSAISTLKEAGYEGGLSIELNANIHIMSALERSLSYLKSLDIAT